MVTRQHVVTVEPELVRGGDEEYVLRRDFAVTVDGLVERIGSFLGVDTGDIVECHAEVVDALTGNRLYARSLHKETSAIFDAWDWQDIRPVRVKGLRVSLLCRVTGRNWTVYTKRWNALTAYFHGQVVIQTGGE